MHKGTRLLEPAAWLDRLNMKIGDAQRAGDDLGEVLHQVRECRVADRDAAIGLYLDAICWKADEEPTEAKLLMRSACKDAAEAMGWREGEYRDCRERLEPWRVVKVLELAIMSIAYRRMGLQETQQEALARVL